MAAGQWRVFGVFLVIATGLLQTDVVLGCVGQTIGSPEYHSLTRPSSAASFGFDCLVRAYRVRVFTDLTVLVAIDETDVQHVCANSEDFAICLYVACFMPSKYLYAVAN